MNLIHEHPSQDVQAAARRLLDALCMWERTTGRHNIVIIKDSIGCEWRSLDGSPLPHGVTDAQGLEAFANLCADENPKLNADGADFRDGKGR